MRVSQFGISMIKKFEGFSAKPYLCPAGLKTIGYGHVILKGEYFNELTLIEGELILLSDLKQYEANLNQLKVKFNQNQFDALISLSFNMGLRNFLSSTLCKYLRNSDYVSAAEEFSRWVFCKGKILGGLRSRRLIEKRLFLS